MSASSSFPPSLRRNLGLTRNRKDLVIKELGCRGMIGTERIGLDAGDSLGALGLNLESTWPGVFDALFSSFSMILVTVIGDDTFIIAALMAMRHPKATVLSGALSALFVLTVILSDPFTRQEYDKKRMRHIFEHNMELFDRYKELIFTCNGLGMKNFL
uniref:GDT1 family protein n=1 Tax=Brassica oleracea var. oleracea TaxID=109376 RepID=A0A0D3BAY3_BRAOL